MSSDEEKDVIDNMIDDIDQKQHDTYKTTLSVVESEGQKHLRDILPLKSKIILGPVDRYFYYG